MEEVFSFKANGETLSGILNLPEGGERPELGIIFANAGARGRLGSTFQYPYYARTLAERGIASLRFDPHGIGDSTGEIPISEMPAFYGSLQAGRFAADLDAAINAFWERVAPKKLVLWGVCGGAITALIAAGRRAEVQGVVLLSVPVLLDSAEQSEEDTLSAGYAREYLLQAYGKKFLSPKSWARLFSGKSEMKTIVSYSRVALKGLLGKGKELLRDSVWGVRGRLFGAVVTTPRVGHGAERHPMFNEHFLESLDMMMEGERRVLCIFGEGDAIRWHFQEHFVEPFWQDDPRYETQCEVHYLPGCNHLFTLREWQDQALELAGPWLDRV